MPGFQAVPPSLEDAYFMALQSPEQDPSTITRRGVMNWTRISVIASQELRTRIRNPLCWILLVAAGLAATSITPTVLLPSADASSGWPQAIHKYTLRTWLLFSRFNGFFVYTFFSLNSGRPRCATRRRTARSTPLIKRDSDDFQ